MGIMEVQAQVCGVYKELAERSIERDCRLRAECCQFHLTGRTPMLTRGEAMVLAAAWRASGRKKPPEPDPAGACPLLDRMGRCLLYEARPFGCRTHFCRAAGGPYPRKDVLDLIRQLEDIDHKLGGDGPHAIGEALTSALAGWSG